MPGLRGRRRNVDPATRYALDVVENRIVTGRLVRLACERHLRDLEDGKHRGLRWDPEKAQRIIDYYSFLRQYEGEWNGRPVVLSPWQQFRLGSVFGWQRQDEETGEWIRRFRKAYNEVARKNGKSTEAGGLAVYMLDADGEPGAQVYSAATKYDQAKIVWSTAAKMVRKSPALRKRIQIYGNPNKPGPANMSVEETNSKFEPVSSEDNTLDGLNIHCGIIDELKDHKTRGVWDAFVTAGGARRQSLIWAITTAGYNQAGVCYEVRDYSIAVLEGRVEDDSWFAYIATLDEEDLDHWWDEDLWIKSNPNLGVSVKLQDLRDQCKQARELPSFQPAFLTKRLNVWVSSIARGISLDIWDQNAGDPIVEEDLLSRKCYGGLDLASVNDLVAWVLVFPRDDDPEFIDVLARFWCPEKRLYAGDNRYREQYQAWAKQGLLIPTPGIAVDYDRVTKTILEDCRKFDLVDLGIDRNLPLMSHPVGKSLADELGYERVVGCGLGFKGMSHPTREFERRLLLGKVHHGGNKVLRWMAGNVHFEINDTEDVKPSKKASQGKIDGIVSLIIALDRAMVHMYASNPYEDGIITG